jgi:hypothetical protein
VTTALNSITATITEQDWVGKMKAWREATTKSPSGMHLGHHKALLQEFPIPDATGISTESKRQQLLKGQIDMSNYAIVHTYSYIRWRKVATFMIRKDPKSSKIHRLRVIHLYEEDLNLLLGVKWRSLTNHCIEDNSAAYQAETR